MDLAQDRRSLIGGNFQCSFEHSASIHQRMNLLLLLLSLLFLSSSCNIIHHTKNYKSMNVVTVTQSQISVSVETSKKLDFGGNQMSSE